MSPTVVFAKASCSNSGNVCPTPTGALPLARDKSAGGKSRSGIGDRRSAHVAVKTAKRRTASSAQWLVRQINDPYVAIFVYIYTLRSYKSEDGITDLAKHMMEHSFLIEDRYSSQYFICNINITIFVYRKICRKSELSFTVTFSSKTINLFTGYSVNNYDLVACGVCDVKVSSANSNIGRFDLKLFAKDSF